MRKLLIIVSLTVLIFNFVGCGNSSTSKSNDGFDDYQQIDKDSYQDSDYPEKYTDKKNDTSVSSSNSSITNNYKPNESYSKPTHTHYYSRTVAKEATCAVEGITKYSCSCGDSYTEPISKKSYHDWEYATCTSPKKCKVCGLTEGVADGHNYSTDGKCYRCNQMDPLVNTTLQDCSLELPNLPQTVSYYSYSGKINSSVKVTDIQYNFEYYGNGKVILTAKFSGEKTYDYRGSGQSDACKIGWKLYDPNGNVFRAGTFSSPSIKIGETFSSQEEDLIYNFEASNPGRYKLVILDTN